MDGETLAWTYKKLYEVGEFPAISKDSRVECSNIGGRSGYCPIGVFMQGAPDDVMSLAGIDNIMEVSLQRILEQADYDLSWATFPKIDKVRTDDCFRLFWSQIQNVHDLDFANCEEDEFNLDGFCEEVSNIYTSFVSSLPEKGRTYTWVKNPF